jgi:hypothetical protein
MPQLLSNPVNKNKISVADANEDLLAHQEKPAMTAKMAKMEHLGQTDHLERPTLQYLPHRLVKEPVHLDHQGIWVLLVRRDQKAIVANQDNREWMDNQERQDHRDLKEPLESQVSPALKDLQENPASLFLAPQWRVPQEYRVRQALLVHQERLALMANRASKDQLDHQAIRATKDHKERLANLVDWVPMDPRDLKANATIVQHQERHPAIKWLYFCSAI